MTLTIPVVAKVTPRPGDLGSTCKTIDRSAGPPDRRSAAVELAAAFGAAKSGSLILAAFASVFTLRYVANLLGESGKYGRS